MSAKSSIEWTDETWNPTVGCTEMSPGCDNCYARIMHQRLAAMHQDKYSAPFHEPRPWPDHLNLPRTWTKPTMVFVNSMSDLFHHRFPLDYIERVFEVMEGCPQHTFQVLTKRAKRLASLAHDLPWPGNVWIGVSVESVDYLYRVDKLRQVPASVRFLSCEPLLGPLGELDLGGIQWVIAGGESGSRARPMDLGWAREIRDQCLAADVPFFLKQLGGRRGKRGGNEAVLDGQIWNAWPGDATKAGEHRRR